MENQRNMMQSNSEMDPNGSLATDTDFSTTASVRNGARELSDSEPTTTTMNPSTGAGYPGSMGGSGYGGSSSVEDDEDLDLTDEDDELDDEDLDDEDDELLDDEDDTRGTE